MIARTKRVAVINDMSGVGKCSLTVAIPILSCLGIEVCPFPTAILSNHTGFSEYYFYDFTDKMGQYKKGWEKLGVDFSAIYSGFLGSEKQIDIILEFIKDNKEALIVVDPVMGDEGVTYSTYTEAMCNKMKELVKAANVVTPNLTEACILTNENYHELDINYNKLREIAVKITELGPKDVIITGIVQDNIIMNYAYNSETKEDVIYKASYKKKYYSGTGDIFSSILCGMLVRGYEMKFSIETASRFIEKAIDFTSNFDIDGNYGVMFEPFLKELILSE